MYENNKREKGREGDNGVGEMIEVERVVWRNEIVYELDRVRIYEI